MDSQGQPLIFRRGVTKWYVYDGLGSVVGEVDASGSLTSSPQYDVYGAVRGNAGTASSRQGFVGGLGHVSDAETGLVYMRARYYDPSNGRFVSEDSGRQGSNWLVYCGNNPVNSVDLNGHYWESWMEAAAKLIWNFYANANGINLGFDPTDNFSENLKTVVNLIDGTTKKADTDIVTGILKANDPANVVDDSEVLATDGSNQARVGLVEKATGAVTKEQIQIIEAWVDFVD